MHGTETRRKRLSETTVILASVVIMFCSVGVIIASATLRKPGISRGKHNHFRVSAVLSLLSFCTGMTLFFSFACKKEKKISQPLLLIVGIVSLLASLIIVIKGALV